MAPKKSKPIVTMFDLYKKVKRSGNFRRKIKKRTQELLCGCVGDTQQILSVDDTIKVEGFDDGSHLPKTSNDDENPTEPLTNWIDCNSDPEECDDSETKNIYIDSFELQSALIQGLSKWAINYQASRHQVRGLLTMLNETLPCDLPIDPRTIFHTPRSICIKNLPDGGLYWHRGLRECLRSKLENVRNVPPQISLNINIDGLPIWESSNKQFWPILFNIHELHFIEPGVIGIFCGTAKPASLSDYLTDFIEETVSLDNEGIYVNNQKICVTIRAFVCDTPARAFIKGKFSLEI